MKSLKERRGQWFRTISGVYGQLVVRRVRGVGTRYLVRSRALGVVLPTVYTEEELRAVVARWLKRRPSKRRARRKSLGLA